MAALWACTTGPDLIGKFPSTRHILIVTDSPVRGLSETIALPKGCRKMKNAVHAGMHGVPFSRVFAPSIRQKTRMFRPNSIQNLSNFGGEVEPPGWGIKVHGMALALSPLRAGTLWSWPAGRVMEPEVASAARPPGPSFPYIAPFRTGLQ